MKSIFVLALLTLSAYCAGCLPVTSDRIYARDLALVDSAFGSLPSHQIVGFAPSPGAKRVFTASDLRKIARLNGVASSAGEDICFEIPMKPIAKEDVMTSMRRALPPETDLTLIEIPSGDFPSGAVEFPLTGLEPPAPGAATGRIWRGSIRYGEMLRMRIWARVDIVRHVPAVVAAARIPRNTRIEAPQLRITSVSAPFGKEREFVGRIEEVIGAIARSDLAAGDPVLTAVLEKPLAVRRGDPVLVEVQSGRARVRMDAVAEVSAHTGDQLDLRNPSSGKVFRARLEDGGKAVIVVGARTGR